MDIGSIEGGKMDTKIERRFVEMRVKKDEEGRKLVGHAAVFNTETDLGWFREMIAPGAFKDSIQVDDVRALFNHDSNFVLGRNKAGTLTLREDDLGLAVEIDPPDTQWARDLMHSMERGDISQMSFGFEIKSSEDQEWREEEGKKDLRIVKRAKLWDVSPVTFPAYPDTDIAVRSHQEWKSRDKPVPWRNSLMRKLFALKFNH
jgi:uncharacterized protein